MFGEKNKTIQTMTNIYLLKLYKTERITFIQLFPSEFIQKVHNF